MEFAIRLLDVPPGLLLESDFLVVDTEFRWLEHQYGLCRIQISESCGCFAKVDLLING